MVLKQRFVLVMLEPFGCQCLSYSELLRAPTKHLQCHTVRPLFITHLAPGLDASTESATSTSTPTPAHDVDVTI
jgi:hypothetical protein